MGLQSPGATRCFPQESFTNVSQKGWVPGASLAEPVQLIGPVRASAISFQRPELLTGLFFICASSQWNNGVAACQKTLGAAHPVGWCPPAQGRALLGSGVIVIFPAVPPRDCPAVLSITLGNSFHVESSIFFSGRAFLFKLNSVYCKNPRVLFSLSEVKTYAKYLA